MRAQLPQRCTGGMTAGEAVVFWLGGFSSDPKYPDLGRRRAVVSIRVGRRGTTLDPIESRKWIFPFDVTRLGPRDDDGYFDERRRAIHRVHDPRFNDAQGRRINFWQYTPSKSEQPYLYFDTSRHPADGTAFTIAFDPPAATERSRLRAARSCVQEGERFAERRTCRFSSSIRTNFKSSIAASTARGATKRFERMSAHGVGRMPPTSGQLPAVP